MKMKPCILGCVTVAILFGCSVTSLKADDLYPPPWARGVPGTTYQAWNFGTIANPVVADSFYNPYGTPTATINGGTWSLFYDNHVGVWTLGAQDSIDLYIPNSPLDLYNYKEVWTQITWQPDAGPAPVVTVDYGSGSSALSALQFTQPAGTGGWLQSVYLAVLPYNPSSENVIVTETGDVGQVVIDTECVPEPSSLALLALGGVSLLSYVSRKR
jgi:hypothetical protein